MATYGRIDGEPVLRRTEIASIRCSGCGRPALLYGKSFEPAKDMRLELFSQGVSIEVAPDLACSNCLQPMQVRSLTSVYWPDEDLPALCWQDVLPEGEKRWFLLPLEEPKGEDDLETLAALAAALEQPEGLIELGGDKQLTDRHLVEHWGRPLSVRERWRLAFAAVAATPGASEVAQVAPGLTIAALSAPALSDELYSALVGKLEAGLSMAEIAADPQLQSLRDWSMRSLALVQELPQPEQALLVRLSEGAGQAGCFQEWLGPYAEGLGLNLIGYAIVDVAVARAEITRIAANFGLPACERPQRSAELTLLLGDSSERFSPLSDEKDVCWFEREGVRFSLEPVELAAKSVLTGVTIAEACAQALSTLAGRSEVVAEAGRVFLEEAGPDWSLEHLWIQETAVCGPAEKVGFVNLYGMLSKFGWDPRDSALLLRFRDIARPYVEPNSVAEATARICGCGAAVAIRHLESSTRTAIGRTGWERPIQDALGQEFLLAPALDCPHIVGWWTEEYVQRALAEGVDLEAELAAGVAQVGFVFSAELLLDVEDLPLAVRLLGPNAATTLVHPQLSAELARQLRPQLGGGELLLAFAPSTDSLVVAADPEQLRPMLERSISEFHASHGDELPGSELGFLGLLAEDVVASGKITLNWKQREGSPAPQAG